MQALFKMPLQDFTQRRGHMAAAGHALRPCGTDMLKLHELRVEVVFERWIAGLGVGDQRCDLLVIVRDLIGVVERPE